MSFHIFRFIFLVLWEWMKMISLQSNYLLDLALVYRVEIIQGVCYQKGFMFI